MIKYVIFDFDGTIADSFSAVLEIYNELSSKYGYEKIKEPEEFKLKSSKQIVKDFNIPSTKLPFFVKKVLTKLGDKNVELFKDIEGVLIELKKKYNLAILTSNLRKNVDKILKTKIDLFDSIQTGSKLFGKNKLLEKFLKSHNLEPEDVVYVGDETRDIKAARMCGIKIISVAWGFNSKAALQKENPDYLITEPHQILDVL